MQGCSRLWEGRNTHLTAPSSENSRAAAPTGNLLLQHLSLQHLPSSAASPSLQGKNPKFLKVCSKMKTCGFLAHSKDWLCLWSQPWSLLLPAPSRVPDPDNPPNSKTVLPSDATLTLLHWGSPSCRNLSELEHTS